jgi:hypothetical protein
MSRNGAPRPMVSRASARRLEDPYMADAKPICLTENYEIALQTKKFVRKEGLALMLPSFAFIVQKMLFSASASQFPYFRF